MKNLVIPDVHNKHVIAQRIIESAPHDQITFLGDYFDDFGDKPDDVRATAHWLKKITGKKIMGNHDLSYRWWTNQSLACSGHTGAKRLAINDVLDKQDWDAMVAYVVVDGWLLSHAGFQPQLLPMLDGQINETTLAETWEKCVASLHNGMRHPWAKVSRYRGGIDAVSGPFWCDWREFMPTENVKQMFGHTPDTLPRYERGYKTETYCIDTHLHHYAIIEDGAVTVHTTPPKFFKK